jgi:hypothetical protein
MHVNSGFALFLVNYARDSAVATTYMAWNLVKITSAGVLKLPLPSCYDDVEVLCLDKNTLAVPYVPPRAYVKLTQLPNQSRLHLLVDMKHSNTRRWASLYRDEPPMYLPYVQYTQGGFSDALR